LVCSDWQVWALARDRCRAWGLGLAIIDDPEENAFLQASLSGVDHWTGANDRGDNGQNCTLSGEEGTWDWAVPLPSSGTDTQNDRGTRLCAFASADASACSASAGQYLNWQSGEPNNKGCSCVQPVCSDGEDCGLLTAATGGWNDSPCGEAAPYICETP
jgi:hypothetical protein